MSYGLDFSLLLIFQSIIIKKDLYSAMAMLVLPYWILNVCKHSYSSMKYPHAHYSRQIWSKPLAELIAKLSVFALMPPFSFPYIVSWPMWVLNRKFHLLMSALGFGVCSFSQSIFNVFYVGTWYKVEDPVVHGQEERNDHLCEWIRKNYLSKFWANYILE